ncbi:MAG: ABC transporter substrate-binding protein [Robiginitomaculum sp.]|nr:MAG: ABC transporter substrate-binding protein [Robiginitomaculum sp.]
MTKMDRRKVLAAGGLGMTGLIAACSGGDAPAADGNSDVSAPAVHTRKVTKLRMVTSWPPKFPGLGTAAEEIAKTVGILTEGSLEIKLYGAGELVPAHQEFDAVSSGAADMYHAAEYYWQGKSKGFAFFAAVPFGMTAIETLAWLEYGGGNQLWQNLSGQFNIIAMAAGSTGSQMGGWFKKEMNTIDDFRGLVMRIPGMGGDVLKALGGVPKLLAGGAIYQALQSGAIDATEWVGPWNDLSFGFYREASYYYGPGFHEPGPILSCGINLDVWNAMTETEQMAVKTACRAANTLSLAEYSWQNQVALKILVEDHGVQVRTFSNEIWKALKEASTDVVAAAGNTDPETKAIYDSYMAALAGAKAMSQYADGTYLRVRDL